MPSTRLAVALASLASLVAWGNSLDTEALRAAMEAHRGEVRECYALQLARQPGLHGKVLVEFVVEAPGVVTEAKVRQSDVGSPELEACLLAVVRRVTFRGWTQKPATIVYPYVFQPAAPAE